MQPHPAAHPQKPFTRKYLPHGLRRDIWCKMKKTPISSVLFSYGLAVPVLSYSYIYLDFQNVDFVQQYALIGVLNNPQIILRFPSEICYSIVANEPLYEANV